MIYPPAFRGLSDTFLDALDALIDEPAAGLWWRDVLAHPDLILSVRNESLNVYHRGASIFRVTLRDSRPVPETHVKYLMRRRQALSELAIDGSFDVDAEATLWHHYAGRQTLDDMIKAANSLSGPEKSLLHPLLQASPNVIDVEIALAGEILGGSVTDDDSLASESPVPGETLEPGQSSQASKWRQDRIDVATLETRGDPKRAWLVFHEVKDFGNPALRAAPKKRPAVLNQLARYRSSIGENSAELRIGYPFVCRALVRFDAMRRKVRDSHPLWIDRPQPVLDPLIREVAENKRELKVDRDPRLVVVGFDADQRDGIWAGIRQRLEQDHAVIVYAVGNPKGVKTTPAFQPPKAVLEAHAKIMADEAAEAAKPPPPPPALASIDMPSGAPSNPALFFDRQGWQVQPVYFVNAGSTALTDLIVTVGSLTDDPLCPMTTRTLDTNGGTVLPGTGVLITHYDLYFEGETLTGFQIDFTGADGSRIRAQAVQKGSAPAWVKLKTFPIEPVIDAPVPASPIAEPH